MELPAVLVLRICLAAQEKRRSNELNKKQQYLMKAEKAQTSLPYQVFFNRTYRNLRVGEDPLEAEIAER